MGKDPAMPLYVNDWLSSPRVQSMTELQELAYFRLCLFCWASGDASLPDDDDQLAAMSRMGKGWFKGGSQVVRKCFNQHPTKPEALTNQRVLELWNERQEWREKSRIGGKRSGEKRRDKKSYGKSKGGARVVEPNGNLSSSSSSSISSSSSSSDQGETPLPPGLDCEAFKAVLADWNAYKRERRETYKPQGMAQMLGAAAERAKAHGVDAVVAAMKRAMANGWQGWDQTNAFQQGKPDGKSKQYSAQRCLTD